MKFSTGTRLAALALMAGLWGCSSSKVAQQSLAYDDLYSSATDVKAVAYSTKRSSATFDPTRTTAPSELAPSANEGTGSAEYYNPELAERYSNRTYTEGYRAGYDDASRWGNNWNNSLGNNWNNSWGGGWNSWNRFNNFYSPWGWGPQMSLNFGWGGGWNSWNRFNNFNSPWGFDPFYSGWGGGFYDGFGGGWGNRYRINNYYGGGYPYNGGNVVIVNPGSNNGGSTPVYANPRRERANYGRSQSAYNSDADRAYSSSSNPANRGGRSSYSTPSNSSDYYSRPKRSGDAYSGTTGNRSDNSFSRPSNNGYNNSNNSYSRSYDRGSSNTSTYSAPARTSAPASSAPSSSPAGGGSGARSRGPR